MVSLMLRGTRVSFVLWFACFVERKRENVVDNIPGSNGLAQGLDGVHRRRSVGLGRRDLCGLGGVGHAGSTEGCPTKRRSDPYLST